MRSTTVLLTTHYLDEAQHLAWLAGGLLLSLRFFRWDPHWPRARAADRLGAGPG